MKTKVGYQWYQLAALSLLFSKGGHPQFNLAPPATPQYCRQPNWLWNCRLKKLRNCDCGLSKFDFSNSATLSSLQAVPLLSSSFFSAQDGFKKQPKIFLELSVFVETKNLPKRDSSMRFFTSNFFHELTVLLI